MAYAGWRHYLYIIKDVTPSQNFSRTRSLVTVMSGPGIPRDEPIIVPKGPNICKAVSPNLIYSKTSLPGFDDKMIDR